MLDTMVLKLNFSYNCWMIQVKHYHKKMLLPIYINESTTRGNHEFFFSRKRIDSEKEPLPISMMSFSVDLETVWKHNLNLGNLNMSSQNQYRKLPLAVKYKQIIWIWRCNFKIQKTHLYCRRPSSTGFIHFRVDAWGIELLSKKNRNTEWHWEGHSVPLNTESTSFIFHMCIYFTPKGQGDPTDFINMI